MHPHGGGVYPHGMGGPPPFPSQQQPLGHAMPAGGAASNAAGAGLLAMLQQGGAGGAGAGPTGPPAPVAAPSAAAQPAPGPQRTSSAHLLSTLTPTSATPKTNAKGATTPRVEEPETKHSDGFIHRTEIPDANNVQCVPGVPLPHMPRIVHVCALFILRKPGWTCVPWQSQRVSR